eukprot:3118188-Pyramimonas_sp.AAC.1
MMKYREDVWGKFWNAKGDTREQLSGVLDALRPLALGSLGGLEPLEPGDLQRAARLFREDTAVGVDQWPPRMLVSLPPDAVKSYTHLLNSCESRLMWPTQILLGIIALLPKSAESERPVCKCPSLCRVHCKARGSHVEDWTLALVNHWDTAVRGSSALQAALNRSLGHEMARYLGMCS